MFISTKWKKWSNFLYFSTYLTLFSQSEKHFAVPIYFHETQKKFLFFISWYMFLFIFTKWITFHQCGLFARSGKNFFNALYFLEVDKCLMNCIIAKQRKKIKTKAGICGCKYEVEKILLIYLHICFYLHEVENTHQYIFTKKYLMIYNTPTKLKLFERETRSCEYIHF